jgi:hypothetical protein
MRLPAEQIKKLCQDRIIGLLRDGEAKTSSPALTATLGCDPSHPIASRPFSPGSPVVAVVPPKAATAAAIGKMTAGCLLIERVPPAPLMHKELARTLVPSQGLAPAIVVLIMMNTCAVLSRAMWRRGERS